MDHPKPELKYVNARELNGTAARLDGAKVLGVDGGEMGTVEGFIMDIRQGRPRHVVVAASGWFTHKHFLLPIGHVALSAECDGLIADISKERVAGSPGFDKSEFEKLGERQLDELDSMMTTLTDDVDHSPIDHYQVPDGW